MRILIACGVSQQREGGGAGIVYNLASALRAFGHSVDCLFHEDLLTRRRLPKRLDAVELAIQAAREIRRRRENYDVVNIHAPFGFAYGFLRKWRRGRPLPPFPKRWPWPSKPPAPSIPPGRAPRPPAPTTSAN